MPAKPTAMLFAGSPRAFFPRAASAAAALALAALPLGTHAPPAAAATAPVVPQPSASLAALVARAAAASGSPYRYHVVSVSHESRDGRTFEVTTETQGLRYRARSCAGAACSGFWFDGERSFETTFNGTALPLSARIDGLQLTLRAIASYAFTAPDFRQTGGELVEREPVLREGRTYRRVGVAPSRGALLDAVIDPRSGLVVGVISEERGLAFEFGDQRKVGGLVLPFRVTLDGRPVESFASRTVDAAPLEAPAGLAPELPEGGAEVPFTPRGAGAPVVACAIGTVAASCLLDTGNSGLAMTGELAAKLGLVPAGRDMLVRAPALAVGAARFPGALYVVTPAARGAAYDAVLGADVFAHARVTIDYGRGRATFAPPQGAGGGTAIGFENFIPTLPVELDDVAVPLALDTGTTAGIEVAPDVAAAHPDLLRGGRIARVAAGDLALRDVPAGLAVPAQMTAKGRLGGGALAGLAVTFDYARGRVELGSRAAGR